MWTDNETDRDFLNFEGVADTVAELIVQARGRPVSIGISGAWGVGKTSLIKLTHTALERKQPEQGAPKKYIYVEFNAWLYQGYDDARAALLDVVATRLYEEAEARQTGLEQVKDFLQRVQWLRLAKLVALPAAAMALGLPPIGLLGGGAAFLQDAVSGDLDAAKLEKADATGAEIAGKAKSLVSPKTEFSPPKEIQALRDSFEATLDKLDVTLVVLIDDLDRCLPETAISTLEAIRLLLFLNNTAFVIAADDDMIRYAVRKHFDELTDPDLISNYFDKLIQIPIKVPTLGIQEVRAYMMMLFVDNSSLSQENKEHIRGSVASQLRQSWQGKRVDRAFIQTLGIELPADLVARLDSAESLAPIMAGARGIKGNPRLIKRFLNALSIRMAISNAQGVGVDESALTKLLLFERLAPTAIYAELASAVASDPAGQPLFLSEMEKATRGGTPMDFPPGWDTDFVRGWLDLEPALASLDLRGALYVSREHAPLVTDADRLSSESAKILAALLDNPDMAASLKESLEQIPKADLSVLMDRTLVRARQEQSWGVPAIMTALIVIAEVDPEQGKRLAGFLLERPVVQIQPDIVPKIREYAWATEVLNVWLTSAVSRTVKNAISKGVQ
jgi:predicted KAP-like P-loop ATPase